MIQRSHSSLQRTDRTLCAAKKILANWKLQKYVQNVKIEIGITSEIKNINKNKLIAIMGKMRFV